MLKYGLRQRRAPGPLGLTALGSLAAWAQEPPALPDPSHARLFHPPPRTALRELSTDRPDQTESAYTVDAGHFQVELDLASATFDRDRSAGGDVRTEAWSIATLNLKAGLLPWLDAQLVLDAYSHVRTTDRRAGTVQTASGLGEFETRLKVNLWGNDGGPTALAVMPFIKWPLPTSDLRNGRTEGGVLIPWAIELPLDWGATVMTGVGAVRNDTDDGHDAEFVNSITFGRPIAGPLSGYVEFFSSVSTAAGADWQGQFDVGFTYALGDDVQLDAGCNFGVTDSAPDYQPFIGLSFRF